MPKVKVSLRSINSYKINRIYLCTLLLRLLHLVVPDVPSNDPEMRSGRDSEMIGFQRVSQSVVRQRFPKWRPTTTSGGYLSKVHK